MYITELEKSQAELEKESLVLRRQQELYRRLYGVLGGN
jgi:hypothetical protein